MLPLVPLPYNPGENSDVSPTSKAPVGTSASSPEAQGDSDFSPIAYHTQQKMGPVIQAPLRQAAGPREKLVVVCVLFTSDLLNWKQSVGSYRDNPAAMHQLLETIMITANPNWEDMQALLNTFLTTENERRMILEKAQEETRQRYSWGEVVELLPVKKDPKWDTNTNRTILIINPIG